MTPENKNFNLREALTKLRSSFTPKARKRLAIGLVAVLIAGGAGSAGIHYYKMQQHIKTDQARTAMLKVRAEKENLNLLSEDQIKTIAAENMGVSEGSIQFKQISLLDFKDINKDRGDRSDRKKDGRAGDRQDKQRGDRDKQHSDRNDRFNRNGDKPGQPGSDAGNAPMMGQNAPNPAHPGSTPDGQQPPTMMNNQTPPADQAQVTPATPAQTGAALQNQTAAPQGQAPRGPVFGQGTPGQLHPIYQVRASADGVSYNLLIDGISGALLQSRVRG